MPGNADTPPYYFAFPAQMSMWGNDVDGDCVSAEEAMNKAVGGIFISEADVIAWATKNGDLNGANLLPVIEQMAAAGMPSGAGIFGDGSPPTSVDYTNTTTLRTAIYEALSSTPAGTIKIGLAAGQLPSGAGNASGWFLVGASPDTNEDHCMCYCGYGTAQQFVDAINSTYGLSVTVPSGIDPTTEGYAAYTWNTIGFFDAVTNAEHRRRGLDQAAQHDHADQWSARCRQGDGDRRRPHASSSSSASASSAPAPAPAESSLQPPHRVVPGGDPGVYFEPASASAPAVLRDPGRHRGGSGDTLPSGFRPDQG